MLNRRELVKLVGALPLLATTSASARGPQPSPIPVSDHFDGERFHNPDDTPAKGLRDLLRWQWSGERTEWPDGYPSPFALDRPPARVDAGMRVVLVGHSSFFIQGGGLNILIDPVWSERASPVAFAGPRRRNVPGIAFDDLPAIDVVLVSHNHYDHLDRATLVRLQERDAPLFVTPLGNDRVIHGRARDMRIVTADWGDTVELGSGVSVRLEPARHWSTRGPGTRNRALWCAFTLLVVGRTLYYAGDTGFGDGDQFRQAAANAGRIDLALLPIGAYAPRWFMKDQHINPEEAVRAFQLLGARQALGCHWGTFQLTDEGVAQPAQDLAAALQARDIPPGSFVAARPGQVWTSA
ncbi:MBL fold metallo-hydrolase [Aurantimonas endophytica]|uniref:MBL fold metallo-hydrolase n=1 Tax=Aurantimonas endophytica TaxID=1522175 RepID=UPI0016066EE1|nr:MBL fold metallo-hydrolase [Aurantimonas endophytica]MCO6403644.1 MBL fold metallo-hydrolase [Aurantimonas endophytica]